MLSSIYTKAYFMSKYSLSSILIRNPCFYNKIKKGGSSERKKRSWELLQERSCYAERETKS